MKDIVAVKDKKNGDWILQNKKEGTVIRFSFENEIETSKAGFPTLVDLKITDFCSFGCTMCYQSSTKTGKHAKAFPGYNERNKFISIDALANALRQIKVLEIVLGGGEPTEHPKIADILKTLKRFGFVVGITTKNYNLHLHPDYKDIIKNVDTIAISCNSSQEVELAKTLYDDIFSLEIIHKIKMPAMYIQNILGLTSYKVLADFFRSCQEHEFKNVTLLGYKDFGFGKKIKPKNIDESWIELVKNSRLNIGIDSVIVSEWKEALLKHGVPKEYLVAGEGKFSMYIDLVEQIVSPSSFSNEKIKLETPSNSYYGTTTELGEKILQAFQKF